MAAQLDNMYASSAGRTKGERRHVVQRERRYTSGENTSRDVCCRSLERNGSSTTNSLRVLQRCLGPLLSLQCYSARTQPTMIEASGRHCVREDIRLEEKDHT